VDRADELLKSLDKNLTNDEQLYLITLMAEALKGNSKHD